MKEYRVEFYLGCAAMQAGLNVLALEGFDPYIVTERADGYGYTVVFVKTRLDEHGYGV